jgi:hypothetical protein
MSETSAIETATETSLKDRLGPVNFGFSQYSVLCNTIGPDATHLLISLIDDRMAWNGDRMDVETIETTVTECLRDIFNPSFRFCRTDHVKGAEHFAEASQEIAPAGIDTFTGKDGPSAFAIMSGNQKTGREAARTMTGKRIRKDK